jgi:NADH-quinone oxidoreductase subunit G
MDTVKLTIDGREISVEKGRTVLQASIENGIHVPYYCYHPGISIEGSCRVCLVKVEKMPKLQTACSTVCADGMVVHTQSADVVEARASVFEFLLINHPLDCPVCDKGGECPLQDFSYSFGPARSRMDFPRRTFDGEGVKADVDFGPTLMLNRNRCILCTRCVRFMREIDGDAQISIADRGNGSEIATFQEQGVHSLLSGNLMDVCPVGAITTRDYRFKSRPWDNPHAIDTICTSCSKGCNTTVWLRGKPEWAKADRLARITPRFEPAVNGYWMCDIGRFDYHWIEGDQRVRQPLIKDAGGHRASSWHDTMMALAGRLRLASAAAEAPADRRSSAAGLRVLVSAHASLEELFLVRRIAEDLGLDSRGVAVSWRRREKEQPAHTMFRIPAVEAPNVTGARDLGFTVADLETPDVSHLRHEVEQGRVAALYVLDPGPEGSIGDVAWIADARARGTLSLLVVQGVVMTPLAQAADFVLPGLTSVEKDGCYTNDQGRVQAASRAIPAPGDAMEDWQILANLAVAFGVRQPFTSSAEIRAAIAERLAGQPAYAGLRSIVFSKALPARTWLQASNPSERWKWDFMFQDLPPVKFAPQDEESARAAWGEGAPRASAPGGLQGSPPIEK